MKPRPFHIAVVSINREKYSETFIHDSFDRFPERKTLLYGGYLPRHFTGDRLLEGEKIPFAQVSCFRKKPGTEELQAAHNLEVWLKKQRVDAVLAHYGPSGVAMMDFCHRMKLPLIVHFHGYDAYRRDVLEAEGRQYPALFEKASALVVVSEDMRRQLVSLGAPSEKVVTCRYGVLVPETMPEKAPPGPIQFAFVGRLVPKKAPHLLLKAFARVLAAAPEVRLRIAGDGEMREICAQIIAKLGLQANVDLLGAVSREEVHLLMASSHAVVVPSRRGEDGDSEGTPLVVMEAAAAARAVIGTRHAGIPDVVCDGETGILVPEGDVEALAEAMSQLVKDPNAAIRMGANAFHRAQKEFLQADYHQKLWRLVREAGKLSQNP